MNSTAGANTMYSVPILQNQRVSPSSSPNSKGCDSPSMMQHNHFISSTEPALSYLKTEPDTPEPLREQDRFLPIANVSRIMKASVPKTGKIAKDAKECVQECVSEFISFITSEASEKCALEKRKTINGEDLIFAMQTLGFDSYVEPLRIYLQKYRESIKGEKLAMSPASSSSGLPSQQMNGGASVAGAGAAAGSSQGQQLMTVTLAASASDHVFETPDGSELSNASTNYTLIPANSNETIVTAGGDQTVQSITTSEGTVLVSAVNQSGATGVVNSQLNGNSAGGTHHNSGGGNPSGMVWTFSSL